MTGLRFVLVIAAVLTLPFLTLGQETKLNQVTLSLTGLT